MPESANNAPAPQPSQWPEEEWRERVAQVRAGRSLNARAGGAACGAGCGVEGRHGVRHAPN